MSMPLSYLGLLYVLPHEKPFQGRTDRGELPTPPGTVSDSVFKLCDSNLPSDVWSAVRRLSTHTGGLCTEYNDRVTFR